MKKILVVLGIILSFTLAAECTSVGAPGFLPERGRYIMGFEYGSVKGRDVSDSKLGAKALDVESGQYLAKILYGLSDRVSLLARIGSSDLKLWNPNTSATYNHSSDLAWGLGVRTIFFEDLELGLSLGGGAQYFTFEPQKTSDNRTAEWTEWDASLYVVVVNTVDESTSLVEPFTLTSSSFHAGARYSDASIDWTYGGLKGSLESDDSFGFFTGFDFVFNDAYILGIEARFSDERAYTATLGFKF